MRIAFALVALVALVALGTGPALAGKIPEQQWAAVQAADTHAKYCGEGVDQTIESSGSAIAEVGKMWASLDGLPERTGATGLLYWRGLLAECLDRQDHAIADLTQFLEAHKHDTTWVEPVRDAIRRLQRMGVESEPSPTARPAGRILGFSLAGLMGAGSGVMGALAGVRSGHRQELETLYYSGSLRTDDFTTVDTQGQAATQDINGFAAGAVGLAAGAATAVLVSALAPNSGGGTLHRIAAIGVPTPGGLWLGIGGHW